MRKALLGGDNTSTIWKAVDTKPYPLWQQLGEQEKNVVFIFKRDFTGLACFDKDTVSFYYHGGDTDGGDKLNISIIDADWALGYAQAPYDYSAVWPSPAPTDTLVLSAWRDKPQYIFVKQL